MNAPSSSDTPSASAPAVPLRQIGVIGLGHMGNAFATNLIADGYQVTVFDRDAKHAAPPCPGALKSSTSLPGRAMWQHPYLAVPILPVRESSS